MSYKISLDSTNQVQNYTKPIERRIVQDSLVFCPIENEGDCFKRQNNEPTKFLYKASDSKNYSLSDFLLSKITNQEELIYKSFDNNFFKSTFDKIKSFFNIGYNTNEFSKKVYNVIDIIETSTDITKMFESITGLKYSDENVEKLLKNEIKLDFEYYAEKIIEKNYDLTPAAPIIEKSYSYNKFNNPNIEFTDQEKIMYDEIQLSLDEKYKNKLQALLDNGKLVCNNKDYTPILESFYKILTKERVNEIDNIALLKECIDLLENPYQITQNAENIPEEYKNDFFEKYKDLKKNLSEETFVANDVEDDEDLLKFRSLSTCSAASIEYSFLEQNPNEFFKMIENLTSENKEYKKIIKLDNYQNKELELQLLNFNIPFEKINESTYEISIKADNDAYFLSKIQVNNKDEYERGICDILAQSAIMNLASKQTYNSITDTRSTNEFSQDTSGLVFSEIDFVSKLLLNNAFNKFCKPYIYLDKNNVIETKINTEIIKKDILKTLEAENNVITGLVFIDDDFVLGGHEVTIVGYEQNLNGNGFFIVQDSDDYENQPVAIAEEDLLSRIHHAIVIGNIENYKKIDNSMLEYQPLWNVGR